MVYILRLFLFKMQWYIFSVFSSSKCSLFHNSNLFGSCIIHILYTGVLKLKKNNSSAKRLKMSLVYAICCVRYSTLVPFYLSLGSLECCLLVCGILYYSGWISSSWQQASALCVRQCLKLSLQARTFVSVCCKIICTRALKCCYML